MVFMRTVVSILDFPPPITPEDPRAFQVPDSPPAWGFVQSHLPTQPSEEGRRPFSALAKK
jgi:hypothetical protein